VVREHAGVSRGVDTQPCDMHTYMHMHMILTACLPTPTLTPTPTPTPRPEREHLGVVQASVGLLE
jgi:hypothetical protein